jgi:hypothetical protein
VSEITTRKGKAGRAIPMAITMFVLCMVLYVHFAVVPEVQGTGAGAGILKLSIIDAITGKPTPARIELLDQQGKAWIAGDAVPVGGKLGASKATLEQALAKTTRNIIDPDTGIEYFYSVGSSQIDLPAGKYKMRVFKGTEFQVPVREINVAAGQTVDLELKLTRWVDMPALGWYSAETHMHIPRPFKEINPFISKWMQAEDLHVANLLEYGGPGGMGSSPQFAHGPEGLYREGDYLLASGQENPRTKTLGHAIILGARTPIHLPETYFVYQSFWQEAKRQNALSGVAHGNAGGGVAVDLPDDLLSFIEVLQQHRGLYDGWYLILNSGFRLAPVAGTDYSCERHNSTALNALPGRERFYVRVDGPFTHASWLEGLRRGRTFVTNGPVIEFSLAGKGIGEEVVLKEAGPLAVQASVRFDPARDQVERLEIIENGMILRNFTAKEKPGEIRCQFNYQVAEPGWLAVRVSGTKPVTSIRGKKGLLPSLAHSGAIYVTLENAPPLRTQRRAKLVAGEWLKRLEMLEQNVNQPSANELKRNEKDRRALLERIQAAKKYFMDVAR